MINLQLVDPSNNEHIEGLYKLLKRRKFNISNNEKTTFAEHKKFVLSNPYRVWFLIFNKNNLIGSCYISYQNSISIDLDENNYDKYEYIISSLTKKFKPLKEVKSIRNSNFYIRINPNNKDLENKLIKLGFILIEKTFKIGKNY